MERCLEPFFSEPGPHRDRRPEAAPQAARRSTRRRAGSCPFEDHRLVGHDVGRERRRRANVQGGEAGKRAQDVIDALAVAEIAQHQIDGNPCALDARLAAHDPGLDRDPGVVPDGPFALPQPSASSGLSPKHTPTILSTDSVELMAQEGSDDNVGGATAQRLVRELARAG